MGMRTLSIDLCADRCGVSVTEIRRLVARHEFPMPIGVEYWAVADVQAWIQSRSPPTISIDRVLAITGLTVAELRRLVRKGQFAPERGHNHWTIDDVEAWVAFSGVRKTLRVRP